MKQQREAKKLARQGVLNLFSLLKARYTTTEQKQQLAILFSLISDPQLQPVNEIRSLLGELDNGTIAEIELLDLSDDDATTDKDYFRLSSRTGGGFSRDDTQVITVEPPAPLGDDYKPAKIRAIFKPTTRILRINVVDGGEGYDVAPDVIVRQKGVVRQCEAYAVINQQKRVSEIIVVNPGYGYGGPIRNGVPIVPIVEIKRRKSSRKDSPNEKALKSAKAVAELEYKVTGVEILDGGSGYIFDEPPEVMLSLPQNDPDWFVTPVINGRNTDGDEAQMIAARVSLMKSGSSSSTIAVDPLQYRGENTINESILQQIQNDPIALLPSYLRPQFSMFISRDSAEALENGIYYIPTLPKSKSVENLPSSSKYRSIDAVFGGIGKAPVIKNAVTLSADQYSRLALAGAICTVVVRTALNPLELVKTKIQLQNDDEIMRLATEKANAVKSDAISGEQLSSNKQPAGTTQEQNRSKRGANLATSSNSAASTSTALLESRIELEDIKPLWLSFNAIVSRELPFAVTKFLVFDSISNLINNSNLLADGNKIQVGVGTLGLLLSAFSGAMAGIAGAFVSHPADLILTLTSASSKEDAESKDWKIIVKELLAQEGGIVNLFAGFPARAVFFFLVIGLQFFLYDYFKTLLDVGTDDLTLVLDVFYAIRTGLQ
eukprot:scaffold248389_cov51-Cyclotella_meneghiniana.AAC.2